MGRRACTFRQRDVTRQSGRPEPIARRPEVASASPTRALSYDRPVPRRGLSRSEAAMYVGIGTSKFDEMVVDGRMPRPRRIDGRKIWDIRDLDLAFDALPFDNAGADSSWDDFDAERGISGHGKG
jgi:predicted DNA-binding transcriptional regulator AlpA